MQKKLIALAIAGLSGAAFAQSNVTIYGAVDLTQESAKADSATQGSAQNVASRSRLTNNSSYIGFKGAESMGNGLTAVFQFESGVNSDAAPAAAAAGAAQVVGAGQTFGAIRDTYVGIAGGFGTVAAGVLTHPIRAMGAKVDFNPGASSAGFTGSMYGEVIGVKTGSDERASNAVAYISPNFNGFTGVLAYVNLENAKNSSQLVNANSTNGKAWQVAGTYENGPLYVGLAWDKHTDPGVAAAIYGAAYAGAGLATPAGTATAIGNGYNDSLTITRLAAKYTFASKTSVSALWDKQKYDITSNAAINTDATRTAYMVGVNQEFGASNVWLQYAVAKDPTGTVCNTITCGDYGSKQWTLGYSYNLSKRTMIHALATKITNDKGVSYDHYVGGVGLTTTGAASTVGADTNVYGVGIRHTF